MKFLRLASSIVLLSVWAISAQTDTVKYEKCFDSVLKSFMGLERELSVRGKPVNFTIDGHDCAATLTTASGGDPLKIVCPMLVPHGPRCINILGDGGTAIFNISRRCSKRCRTIVAIYRKVDWLPTDTELSLQPHEGLQHAVEAFRILHRIRLR